ncbi:17075_t:CDS:2, partial [Cetraspora pellucida]
KYNKEKKTEYSGPEIFGLQLKFVEKEQLRKYSTGILQPINNLSKSAQRMRVNKIAEQEYQTFNKESKILYHPDDYPTLQSLTYKVSDQTWTIQYDSKDEINKQQQINEIVYALDQKNISREAYRALAAISFDLPREYTIATTQNQINKTMQKVVSIQVLDINSKGIISAG